MWGSSVVLGAQLEGGVANVRVNMTSNANNVSSGISTTTNTSASRLPIDLDDFGSPLAIELAGVLTDSSDNLFICTGRALHAVMAEA